jgi:Fe-S cluster biogenesis protein NfuA
MREEIERILGEIRPLLQGDGGDLELVEADEKTGVVKVRLQGACANCPMANLTLKWGIEARLKEKVPGVKEVIAVE